MDKIRVGIVGVGSIAQSAHLPHYAGQNDVEVAAFADPETERVEKAAAAFAQKHGVAQPPVYATMEEMIAAKRERIDAVSICTPNAQHVPLAREALAAGWHTLLEKPMGTETADVEALTKQAEDCGRILMIGMTHRYREDVEVVKRYIDAGELGDIYFAKTRILRRRGTPKGWFTDRAVAGGGPLMDIGVHALDLTWWLTGAQAPATVSGFLHRGIGQDHLDFIRTWEARSAGNEQNEIYTTEDFAAAFIRFKSGMVIEMEVSWALNGPEDDALKVEIFGAKGGVSLDPLRIYGTAHRVLTTTEPAAGMGSPHEREIGHFLDCIRSGRQPLSTAEQGLQVVRMLSAISESSLCGREVALA